MSRWPCCLVRFLPATLILLGGPSHGDFAYRLTPLGTLDGGSLSRGFGINGAGQVAGEADTSLGNLNGFFWAGGGSPLVDIGTLDGGNASRGMAINDAGQVAGQGRVRSGFAIYTHAFRTGADGRNPVDLGVLDASRQYSVAHAIADDGQVAGTSVNADGLTRAVLWGWAARSATSAPLTSKVRARGWASTTAAWWSAVPMPGSGISS